MDEQRTQRVNRLAHDLPEGLVVDGAWLEAKGYASNLRTYYTKTGWLDQPVRGVYRRPRGPLKWQQVVISLQTLLLERHGPLCVGGRTALALDGHAHYLSPGIETVHLYGPKPPPSWVFKLPVDARFVYHSDKLFAGDHKSRGMTGLAWDIRNNSGRDLSTLQGGDFTTMSWGQWDWPLTLSSPERAMLELLDELPHRESFDQADKLMEGLSNLRPRHLQKLLADCRSVKVKRLFFFFADRHRHAWLKRLDKSSIDLGSGKRSLVSGGRLDPVYNITVPEALYGRE
ncbi:type IV toxin-antitoxin system AbiEi family antitoxin [Aquibium sp. ELW1220]|uniref:type IV toxin-antitoxin system AbiEi family antitoxin n=1 Tax=Aquibium sp. ELW1220 TaxID=2976766 RepID=UPI0025B0A4F6|nr:type IV toxin-antitoxin system AbiEi family antitoxin [Aquibium sp. ELW1220]MDN2579232.1 type IV toxin-antitoxin system AbiEi family antitoxin [Aquibium sp. ELW1220]